MTEVVRSSPAGFAYTLRAQRGNARAVHAPRHSKGRQDQLRRAARAQVSRLGRQMGDSIAFFDAFSFSSMPFEPIVK